MSDNRELEALFRFWKDSLAEHRLLMAPSIIYLVEQTIKSLEELKQIKEARSNDHESKTKSA